MANFKQDFLVKWRSAALEMQIPSEFYSQLLVRRIEDESGKIDYPMAVIYNPGRAKRPAADQSNLCRMCKAINETEKNEKKNILLEALSSNLVVTPNVFPPAEGATLLISRQEIPMYNTKNLSYFGKKGEFLTELLNITKKLGLKLYHQTGGAGATVVGHEHFHGATFFQFNNIVENFGFDYSGIKKVSEEVSIIPNFPFAHVVFNENNPEKIVNFLDRLNKFLPSPMGDGSIPHTLSQGEKGILIAPLKINVGRSMGSERAPGYFYVYSKEEFDSITYKDAMVFMQERFFPKSIGLEKII